MVQYLFAKDVQEALLSGRSNFILAPQRKAAHARLGDALEFRPGPKQPIVATGVCSFRGSLLFNASGIRRVLMPEWLPAGEPVALLFNAAEQGAPQAAQHLERIAAQDGFDNWVQLVDWHAEAQPPAEDGLLVREVIGFAAVKPIGEAAEPEPPPAPWVRNDEDTLDVLALIDVQIPASGNYRPRPGLPVLTAEALAGWTDDQVQLVEAYAGAVYAQANENEGEVPPVPAEIAPYLPQSPANPGGYPPAEAEAG